MESREPKILVLEKGTSWFQLLTVKAHLGELRQVDEVFVDTERGLGGFGSTGNVSTAVDKQATSAASVEIGSGATLVGGAAAVQDAPMEAGPTEVASSQQEPE